MSGYQIKYSYKGFAKKNQSEIPEEGRRTHRRKRREYKNEDEDNNSITPIIKMFKLHLRNSDNLL